MRGNLYSKPLSLRPSGKESSCPVTLALFQNTFSGLGAEGKKHSRKVGREGGKAHVAPGVPHVGLQGRNLKEKVFRSGFGRNLCIKDY